MDIFFLTIEEIIQLHDFEIKKYGGSFGVRDISLLESAIEMPKSSFGEEYMHSFPFEMAAAYLFHISKNHPFLDGNKRGAFIASLIFLNINNYQVTASNEALEKLVLDTATGKLSKKEISEFFKQNTHTR